MNCTLQKNCSYCWCGMHKLYNFNWVSHTKNLFHIWLLSCKTIYFFPRYTLLRLLALKLFFFIISLRLKILLILTKKKIIPDFFEIHILYFSIIIQVNNFHIVSFVYTLSYHIISKNLNKNPTWQYCFVKKSVKYFELMWTKETL